MKTMKKLLLFLLIILLVMPIVAASYITIQSSINSTENEAIIKVTNLGAEAAYNVQLSLEATGRKTGRSIKKQLGGQESFEWNMPLGLKYKNPGKYPIILTANYQDANSYPFSAISVSTVDYKQATISDIAAKINSLGLSDEGLLELKIKNTAETAKEIGIRLIVPRELTANRDRLSAKVQAKSEMPLEFEIEKFSALTGSSYAVFAVVEYDEGSRHYTSMASGAVKITEKKNIFTNQSLLIGFLVILLIIFVYFQLKKKN